MGLLRSADASVSRRRLLLFGLLVPLALFLAQAWYLHDYGIDDAAISFRYARHLAEGDGLTWNPGQPPVEGFSNLLWVLFLAAGNWLGFDIELFAKVAGINFAAGTLILLWILCRRLWDTSIYRWVPVWAVALSPVWVMWTVSGLELALFGLLLMFIVFSLSASPGRSIWLLSAGVCCLSLARPEGFALAGLFLIFGYPLDRDTPRSQRAIRYGIPALVLVCCAGGLVLFRLAYFGSPAPNTVYAKFSAGLPSKTEVAKWLLFILPFLAAHVSGIRRPSTPRSRLILSGACILVIAQMLVALPVSPVMYFLHRYQIALLPLAVLAVPAGLDWVAQRGRWPASIAAAFILAWVMLPWPAVRASYRGESYYYHRHRCVVEKLARLPGRPLIALLDAGRIPYWSDLPAVDVWGLCDARIAREGFSADAILRGAFGAPDVYIMTASVEGTDVLPRLGYDKLISADSFFQEKYRLWQVCRGEYYYGYAILLNVDWAARHGLHDGAAK